jgi:hypothetical protein
MSGLGGLSLRPQVGKGRTNTFEIVLAPISDAEDDVTESTHPNWSLIRPSLVHDATVTGALEGIGPLRHRHAQVLDTVTRSNAAL